MLKIKSLNCSIENKQILFNIDLHIKKGETHVLMGPNGSGKSTLAKAIMGHPDCEVHGDVIFNGKNISKLETYKRARAGIYLAFQNPPEIEGVNFRSYLRLAYNSMKKKNEQLSVMDFKELLIRTAKEVNINEKLLERNLNEGLSGGEKKKMEVLQMLILKPRLIILDETDSGLDIDSLKSIFTRIAEFKKEDKDLTILLITHYHKVFDILHPDRISIIKEGHIVKSGDSSLIKEIEQKGFSQYER